MKLSYTDVIRKYGPIINNKWEDEDKWCVIYHPPKWFSDQVVNTANGFHCMKIYMNKDMIPLFDKALELLVTRGLSKELKTFDGCQNVRMTRGSVSQYSAHSWGIAIDLNASDNVLGGPVHFSTEFLECFRDAGFTLGAEFKRVDGMHFSLGF